jgi:hypothetical protein
MKIYVVNIYIVNGDDDWCEPHTFTNKVKADQFLSKFMYDGDWRMKVIETETEDETVVDYRPNIPVSIWFNKGEVYARAIGESNVDKEVVKVSIDGNYTLVKGTVKPKRNECEEEFRERVEREFIEVFKEVGALC